MIWVIVGFYVFQVASAQNVTVCTNSTCPGPTSDCRVGTAINSTGNYTYTYCICYAGWRGPTCKIDLDECHGQPCYTTGQCVNTVGSYTCTCLSGWMGVHCEVRDIRVSPPVCIKGWKGSNCTDDVDECTELSTVPCQPHGSCINKAGSYSCSCHPGWKGRNCTDDIDECLHNPCKNGGTCSNYIGSYSCSCASPWNGTHCNTSQCSSGPCLHGGICNAIDLLTYSCNCTVPWAGHSCQQNTTCNNNPCQNGGKCSNMTGSPVCTCSGSWYGKDCNISKCIGGPCLHGGLCTPIDLLTYDCSCKAPWAGHSCQQNTTCSNNPCQNGGKCSNMTGLPVCTCAAPWGGPFCDVNMTTTIAERHEGSSKLPFIIGVSVGSAVFVLTVIAASVAIWWWFIRNKQVAPSGNHTIIEVLQNTSTSTGNDVPEMFPKKRAEIEDGATVNIGVPSASAQGSRDFVVKTKLSLKQGRN